MPDTNLMTQISLWLLCYSLGYFRCSLAWLILLIILIVARHKKTQRLTRKKDFTRDLANKAEKDAVLSAIDDLPSRVQFPDLEKAEWVNKIFKQLWDNVNNYVHDFIKDLLEEQLNKKIGKYGLSGLTVEKLIVGTVPFRVGGLVVFENASEDEIILDMDVSYAGDCDIMVKFSKVSGSLKDFQIYGRLRVILKPLINRLPLVGGCQIFFLNPPDVDFNLNGLAGVLELPVFNEILKKALLDTISSRIVLPNKYLIRLSKLVSKENIQFPRPKGVLRVHLVQARNLMRKDFTMSGQHTSDPYAILEVGDQHFKTPVSSQTENPKWDFWCEFVIEQISGVYLFIKLWDEDYIKDDEWLGKTRIPMTTLTEDTSVNKWCQLERAKHGEIFIRTSWLNLSSNFEDLSNALSEVRQLRVATLNSALLIVYINSAENLEVSKKMELCVLTKVGKQENFTKALKKASSNPIWEEGFTFLVPNPEQDCVKFEIMNEKDELSLGEFTYSISALLGENDLTVEQQSLRLSQCKTEGRIIVSMTLRILKNDQFDDNNDKCEGTKNRQTQEYSNMLSSFGKGSDNIHEDSREHSNLSASSSVSSVVNEVQNDIMTDILSKSKIKLTLRYSVQRQRLIIVVHHIEDLHFDEAKGIYVKLYLLPERHKDTKRKTQVIKTAKNPVFDETFEFVMSQDELNQKHLEVSICEERVIKNEDLEKVVIDLENLGLVLPHTELFSLYKKSHES